MVSKTVLLFLFGQILLAILFFYLLPISSAIEYQKSSGQIEKSNKPIINLKQGSYRGLNLVSSFSGRSFATFLGVPYAQPPVGPLRFARPKYLDLNKNTTDTVQEATKIPPKCPQYDEQNDRVVGHENCLNLNIYVPLECCSKMSKGCPLMIWIHPGDFLTQDASPKRYGPDLWMDQDVIIVAIQYRLGPFGFLSTENEEAPGNLGLRDQALALEWIKSEAENFFGNPNKITVFGSGSGGASAFIQMLSPTNARKNLFRGIISQSGIPLTHTVGLQSFSSKELMLKFAKSLGCLTKKTTLECLKKKVDTSTIILKSLKFPAKSWQPMIDKEFNISDPFIPGDPMTLLKNGNFSRDGNNFISVMLGHNTEEGLIHLAPFIQNSMLFKNISVQLPSILFPTHEIESNLVKMLKKFYIPEGKISNKNVQYAINMVSDFRYIGPIKEMVDCLKKYQPQLATFYYHFGHTGSHSLCDKDIYPGWKFSTKLQLHNIGIGYNMKNGYGVCRQDELLYFFILANQPPPMNAGPLSENDKEISKKLIRMWTYFAHSANPTNSQDKFHWASVKSEDVHLEFALLKDDFSMETDQNHFKERMKLYKKVTEILHNQVSIDSALNEFKSLRIGSSIWSYPKNSFKSDL